MGYEGYWLGKKRSLETCEKIRQKLLKNPVRYWLGKKRLSMIGNKFGCGKHPWNKNSQILHCKTCGKKFEINMFQIKQGRKYCSIKCYGQALKGSIPWNKGKKTGLIPWNKKPKIKRICQICGKYFEAYLSVVKKGGAQCCSKKCAIKRQIGRIPPNKKPKVEKICSICERKFYVIPSMAKLRKFCSNKCWYQYKKDNPYWAFWNKGKTHSDETKKKISIKNKGKNKGFENPNWQGGLSFEPYGIDFNKALKELIRQRDNHKCQICNVPQLEFINKLSVHHIDYDKRNNNTKNLISLCIKCHKKTSNNRKYWTDYFSNIMRNKEVIQWQD